MTYFRVVSLISEKLLTQFELMGCRTNCFLTLGVKVKQWQTIKDLQTNFTDVVSVKKRT